MPMPTWANARDGTNAKKQMMRFTYAFFMLINYNIGIRWQYIGRLTLIYIVGLQLVMVY